MVPTPKRGQRTSAAKGQGIPELRSELAAALRLNP